MTKILVIFRGVLSLIANQVLSLITNPPSKKKLSFKNSIWAFLKNGPEIVLVCLNNTFRIGQRAREWVTPWRNLAVLRGRKTDIWYQALYPPLSREKSIRSDSFCKRHDHTSNGSRLPQLLAIGKSHSWLIDDRIRDAFDVGQSLQGWEWVCWRNCRWKTADSHSEGGGKVMNSFPPTSNHFPSSKRQSSPLMRVHISRI